MNPLPTPTERLAALFYRLLPLLGMVLIVLLAMPSAFAEELVLATLLKEAVQVHPDIISSQMRTQAARTLMLQADVLPNPLLSIATIPVERGNPYFRRADKVLRVDQTVERGDKRDLRKQLAAATIESVSLEEAAIRRQSLADTARTLIELKRTEQRLQLAREQEIDGQKLAEAARFRVKEGDLSAVEASRIQADALRSRNDRIRAEQALDKARLALSRLVSATPQRALGWTVADDWSTLTPEAVLFPLGVGNAGDPTAPDGVAERLPDNLAGLRFIQAAQRQRDLAQAQRTRDVGVSSQLENKPDQGGSVIGIGVSIPLLLGNDFSGDIARAEADIRQAEAEWMSRLRQLQAELRSLAQSLPALQATAQSLRQDLLPTALQNADKLNAAYRQGAASLIDLLDARRQAFNAQNETIDAQAELASARQTVHFIRLQLEGALP